MTGAKGSVAVEAADPKSGVVVRADLISQLIPTL